MANRQKMRFVVLCEGETDYHFARGYLIDRFGKRNVDITRRDVPVGAGAGEQHVRRLYPEELKARRTKPATENLWLVVLTDADSKSVRQRIQELESAARTVDVQPPLPAPSEKVLILCPKRNIESWIYWATGECLDDTKNYKLQYEKEGGRKYGEKAHQRCLQTRDIRSLNGGLREACEQLAKLD